MDTPITTNIKRGFVCFALCLAMTACERDPQLTPGSSLSIYPAERTIRIAENTNEAGVCLFNENSYQDSPLSITVTNEAGFPVGDTEVAVYVDYSGNTYSGIDALALYADQNGNGVIDHPEELVSAEEDAIYKVKTGSYTGEITLLLRINLSCPYRGQVHAFAGPVAGSMDVSITTRAESSGETDL